jgi:predicted small lipoprotein YifL
MSLRSSVTRLMAVVAIASSLTGCGKDSPMSPATVSQQDADDSAQQVGFMMAQGGGGSPFVTARTDPAGSAAVAGIPRSHIVVSPQEGEPDAGSTVSSVLGSTDTTFAVGNVTWTLSRTWFDASNNEQTSYDPMTTVRVSIGARGTGMIETPTDTASFGCAGNLDIAGISVLQNTLSTNGARHYTLQCSFTPRFRTGRIHTYEESAGTLANVMQTKPVTSNPWPTSGTATWSLKIDRLATGDRGSVTRHYDVTVIVTFNGTQNADVVVSGGWHYTLDLLTGRVVRV